MALLTNKDDIYARSGRRYETVKVPELGDDIEVRVQSLNGAEWEEYENSLYFQKRRRDGNLEVRLNNSNKRAKLVVLCVVDEVGQLVFDPKADVIRVSNMDAGAVDRIYEACLKLCGKDEDAAEAAEENFGDAQSGRSTTDSPPNSAAPSLNSSHELQPMN